jgi:hypothetical protein
MASLLGPVCLLVYRIIRRYDMNTSHRIRWLALPLLLALLIAAALPTTSRLLAQSRTQTVSFDIAEIPSRFAPAPFAMGDDGMPLYGNPFVTQGYLYPVGTLDNSDGINPDGSPAFPDKVLGEWSCWGYHIRDAGRTVTEPAVVTNQLFQITQAYGAQTIVSNGYEFVEPGRTFTRAIVGGTGIYSAAGGEQAQTFLGWTPYNSVKLRVTLTVVVR